ncbi:MAG: hypothetical protein ACRYFV_15615 [Janthinobacterium lividum]
MQHFFKSLITLRWVLVTTLWLGLSHTATVDAQIFNGLVIIQPKRHSFYEELAVKKPSQADTIRLYIDRLGSIYPPAPYLPDKTFEKIKYIEALDEWYYAPKQQQQLIDLSKYCGFEAVTSVEARAKHWDRIQDTLAVRMARAINVVTSKPSSANRRTLLVLIHGYNNAATESPFAATRSILRAQPALSKAVWLEVRWDGLHQPLPFQIWPAAQLNGRYAGIALREVLWQTDPATPLRIFTHSSGAIVASQALWNSRAGRVEDSDDIRKMYEEIPTPTHGDVRVGMIVPATPPDVFYDFQRRTVAASGQPAHYLPGTEPQYRVVLGQNARDFAVSKGGLLAGSYGVTTLGCKEWAFEQARDSCHCGLQKVEFSQASGSNPSPPPYGLGPGKKLEQHDWGLYWKRPQSKEFLRKVLE